MCRELIQTSLAYITALIFIYRSAGERIVSSSLAPKFILWKQCNHSLCHKSERTRVRKNRTMQSWHVVRVWCKVRADRVNNMWSWTGVWLHLCNYVQYCINRARVIDTLPEIKAMHGTHKVALIDGNCEYTVRKIWAPILFPKFCSLKSKLSMWFFTLRISIKSVM